MTNLPTNESELQLYRVLQRANLLKYYDSFISHGKIILYYITVTKCMLHDVHFSVVNCILWKHGGNLLKLAAKILCKLKTKIVKYC